MEMRRDEPGQEAPTMMDTTLLHAVEEFAEVTLGLSEADLERPWAWGAYDKEGIRFAFFRTYEELRELAALVTTERLQRGQGASTAQRLLARYHAAYRDLQAALLGIDEDAAGQAPAEGEWPAKKVLGHIVGGDVGFFVVTGYALGRYRGGEARPAQIPDEAWEPMIVLAEPAFDAMLAGPLTTIFAFHQAWHERVLQEFADIGEDEMNAPSMYWEGQPMSLRFRLLRFDSHVRQHTVQVNKTLLGIGQPPSEAKRLLRLIYAALADAEGATIGAWEAGAELRLAVSDAINQRAQDIADRLTSDIAPGKPDEHSRGQ
jgi:hypothetical protein